MPIFTSAPTNSSETGVSISGSFSGMDSGLFEHAAVLMSMISARIRERTFFIFISSDKTPFSRL